VQSCDICPRFKTKNRPEGILTSLKPSFVMEFLTVDIKHMPTSKRGYKYFIVFVENFCHFAVAEPLKAATTAAVIPAFQSFFLRFGLCKTVLADFGSCFISRIFKTFLRNMGCKIDYATIGFHSLTGAAESAIKSISAAITASCNQALDNWPDVLQAAVFSVNTSRRHSLSASPFSLMYGYEALTPLTMLTGCLPPRVTPPQKLLQHFRLRTRARQHLFEAQQKQKHYFELRRVQKIYRPHDKVFVFRPSQKRNKKFLYKWVPGIIVRRHGPSSYFVRVPWRTGRRVLKYHVTHLKYRFERPPHLLPPLNPQYPCLSTTPVTPLKFCSYNLASFRAFLKKDGIHFLKTQKFDFMLFQETKCHPKVVEEYFQPLRYFCYTFPSQKIGYAGIAIVSRFRPSRVVQGLPSYPHAHARVLTLHYDHFTLVSVYSPFAGEELQNLSAKTEWQDHFFRYVCDLLGSQPYLIIAGDFNVAITDVDISPAELRRSPAGTTPAERNGFSSLLQLGLVDTFRHFYPSTRAYSFWRFGRHFKAQNQGIRLDYFLVSRPLVPFLKDANVHVNISGSDHAPITLQMQVPEWTLGKSPDFET
jgi:exodeoxyribonuclease-3